MSSHLHICTSDITPLYALRRYAVTAYETNIMSNLDYRHIRIAAYSRDIAWTTFFFTWTQQELHSIYTDIAEELHDYIRFRWTQQGLHGPTWAQHGLHSYNEHSRDYILIMDIAGTTWTYNLSQGLHSSLHGHSRDFHPYFPGSEPFLRLHSI